MKPFIAKAPPFVAAMQERFFLREDIGVGWWYGEIEAAAVEFQQLSTGHAPLHSASQSTFVGPFAPRRT